ncbi:MAG TPA: hypothetical protein VEB43_06280 [Anaeromyxobacter sp.]|nr:hypothetical protein [Anaeromyxobacter sp.]
MIAVVRAPRARPLLAAVLVAAGCATAGTNAPPARPADAPLAPDTALSAGAPSDADFAEAWESARKGDAADAAGRTDEARAEWTRAADRFLAAGETHPVWRLALGLRAAGLYRKAGADERAAEIALRVARDPAADARSKALGFRLGAIALQDVAGAQVKAGKLPALKLAFADERPKGPAAATPIPGTWKRFVDAVDGHLAAGAPEPDGAGAPTPTTARLALEAARVAFAFDDLADARRRLAALLERWPEDEAASEAVPLYLQTFLVAGDRPAFEAAAAKLGDRYAAGAGLSKEGAARGADALRKALSDLEFSDARKLMDAGKFAEAAEAYEAIAGRGDPAEGAGALHNAAIAWDRAGKPARAVAARERILKDHPGARVAPTNALALAAAQSRSGDHGGAARLYVEFLERWPDHASRCIAMQNAAAELDAARRGGDAAERYLAFGRDAACAKVDPAVTVTALRRARALFEAAGKPARAREAAAAADAVGKKPVREKAP